MSSQRLPLRPVTAGVAPSPRLAAWATTWTSMRCCSASRSVPRRCVTGPFPPSAERSDCGSSSRRNSTSRTSPSSATPRPASMTGSSPCASTSRVATATDRRRGPQAAASKAARIALPSDSLAIRSYMRCRVSAATRRGCSTVAQWTRPFQNRSMRTWPGTWPPSLVRR